MSGPLSFEDINGDHTLSTYDSDVVLRYNTSGKLLIPSDADGGFPRGMQVAVESLSGTVRIVGADGVQIEGADRLAVGPLRTGVMVKENANFWLLSLGSSGGGGGSAPTAPKSVAAYPNPGGILVSWDAPEDDGGHSITSYTVEYGLSSDKLDRSVQTLPDKTYVAIGGLTAGSTYYAWVKASNSVGTSDPSSVVSAKPATDFNKASGGTETIVTRDGRTFRRHRFSSDGNLVVTKAVSPFTVAVVAGGGSGGGGFIGAAGYGGGHGGGGGGFEKALPLEVKSHPVKVGAGGAASAYNGGGKKGGASSLAGLLCGGGGGGQNGQSYQDAGPVPQPGDPGSEGGSSTGGTGAGSSYTFPGQAVATAYGLSGVGQGGGGGGQDGPGGGAAGQNGAVVVEYEISPFNDMTSTAGSFKDVDNYNGSGHTWRVWTLTSGNATITVNNSVDKFRVLCVAGGGGGAGRSGNNAQGSVGGSGGAGGAKEWQNAVLPEGQHACVVGGPGGGGDGQGGACQGGDGGDTSIAGTEYITHGGGGGGSATNGRNGGSGGGGGSAVGNWNGPWGGGSGMSGEGAAGTGGGPQGSGGSGGHIDLKSDITGASVSYSNGAYGNGGPGRGWDSGGGAGSPGVLIIAYRIK